MPLARSATISASRTIASRARAHGLLNPSLRCMYIDLVFVGTHTKWKEGGQSIVRTFLDELAHSLGFHATLDPDMWYHVTRADFLAHEVSVACSGKGCPAAQCPTVANGCLGTSVVTSGLVDIMCSFYLLCF